MIHINMNKILLLASVLIVFLTEGVVAQQEGQQTMFMFNSLSINPAIAGSRNEPSFTLLHRSQWIGFDGAPSQQTISFHSPFLSSRLGVGFNISNRRIGMFETQTGAFSLSYSIIKAGDFAFRMGLQGSAKRMAIKPVNDEQVTILTNERLNVGDLKSRYFGNFGAGAFITYKDCFIGVSVPFIYSNIIGFDDRTPTTAIEMPHYYLIGGLSLELFNKLYFKPSGIIKKVNNAPWSIEMNATMTYDEKITGGIGFRGGKSNIEDLGESISFLMYFQVAPKWGIGGAYDLGLSQLAKYNKGSFELLARYDLKKPNIKFSNPRVFY